METIYLFMPLLPELGGFGGGLCYKHVAPNGALAAHRHLLNKAKLPLRFRNEIPRLRSG